MAFSDIVITSQFAELIENGSEFGDFKLSKSDIGGSMKILEIAGFSIVIIAVVLAIVSCSNTSSHHNSFKFGDQVVVTDGFFEGQMGKVVSNDDTYRIGISTEKYTIYPLSFHLEHAER